MAESLLLLWLLLLLLLELLLILLGNGWHGGSAGLEGLLGRRLAKGLLRHAGLLGLQARLHAHLLW